MTERELKILKQCDDGDTCKFSVLSEPDPPLECRDKVDGSSYKGRLNRTYLGQTCQRWDQQTPHSYVVFMLNHRDKHNSI